jgi:ketosteroid isomerase-like protein
VSRENVEIIRRSQEHFMRTGDFAWDLMDPAIEIHDHDLPDVGVYHGHAGLSEWTAHWGSAWENWAMESPEYVDAGERVVMLFTMRTRGQGSGVELDRHDAIIFSLADARITLIDYYNDQSQALESVEVRESPGRTEREDG